MKFEDFTLYEISARYGVPIQDGVQITKIPMGQSGAPEMIWSPKRRRIVYKNASERPKWVSKGAFRSKRATPGHVVIRRERVRALHAEGKTSREIMEALGATRNMIGDDYEALGIKPNIKAATGSARERRRAENKKMTLAIKAASHCDLAKVAEQLGISLKRAMGIYYAGR